MKRSISLLLAVLTLATASAYADRGYHCGYYHHCHDDDGGLLEILLSLYTTTTTDAPYDDRAIYVQNVQDDAAAYLAGGEESALLQEAMTQLRAEKGVTGTDAEIASQLISE